MNEQVRRLSKAACTLDGIYWHIAKCSNVKENLLWLLYALDDGESHTQKQICDEWLFPKTTINTLIKECEKNGYVTLEQVPGKKRDLHICLTKKGRKYAENALRLMYEIEDTAMANVLKECSPTFIDDFEKFTKAFQDAAGKYGTPNV